MFQHFKERLTHVVHQLKLAHSVVSRVVCSIVVKIAGKLALISDLLHKDGL